MARKIASILEGGDPTQKGTSKFEKQRQRAEKYTLEGESTVMPTLATSNYRPLFPLQNNNSPYVNYQQPLHDTSNIPDCITNSLNEAQFTNPLRFVGAPEEFKQIHMQVEMELQEKNYVFLCRGFLGTCYAYKCSATSCNESRCRFKCKSR